MDQIEAVIFVKNFRNKSVVASGRIEFSQRKRVGDPEGQFGISKR